MGCKSEVFGGFETFKNLPSRIKTFLPYKLTILEVLTYSLKNILPYIEQETKKRGKLRVIITQRENNSSLAATYVILSTKKRHQ